jgi:acyl-coenzyme A thioesterase PaaI-like protein
MGSADALASADLRVDYFLPIHGPEIGMEGEILHRSGRTGHVQVKFIDDEGRLCAPWRLTLIEHRP